MTKKQLHEVFGIGREIPQYTYVDRSGLDKKFSYLLKTERHIVIHGASKQGKSCLRKKNLTEENCVIVQCLPSMASTKDILTNAFRIMKVPNQTLETSTDRVNLSAGSSATGGADGLIVKGSVSGNASTEIENETTVTSEQIGELENDIRYLAEKLKEKNKKLVLEDFHYLNEDVRKQVAFSLKALYELGVYVIIIGIWSEQNLLTYYNGDLTGRIEEINLIWFDPELEELLVKGETALNIKFSAPLRKEMINSSFDNVGLFQRIAEKMCKNNGIFETQDQTLEISANNLLMEARKEIIKDIGQRYRKIFEVFAHGFRAETQLKVYYYIFKAIATKIDEQKLYLGMPASYLLECVQTFSDKIRQSDLTSALDRIERLQASKQITPLLVSYNRTLKTLSLTDREFLFYKKYSDEEFDWIEENGEATSIKK